MMATRKTVRQKAARGQNRLTFYSRSVVCELCRVSDRELRQWEAEELIVPARIAFDDNDEALYDSAALERIRLIRMLSEELDVNLPGIGIILHLLDKIGR
jgi:DNA-binding transcriptional MerR regulator